MEDPGNAALISQIVVFLILTILNGFLIAGKTAFLAANRNEVELYSQKGNKKYISILNTMDDNKNFIIGNKIISYIVSVVAIMSLFNFISNLVKINSQLLLLLNLVICIIFYIVLGDIFPQSIALHKPDGTLKITFSILKVMSNIVKPITAIVTGISTMLLKITRTDSIKKKDKVTRTEVMSVLKESRTSGTIDAEEFEMLEGIISFNDKTVREVMVPRTDSFMIDINNSHNENIDLILNQPFSRIPVYGGDKDKVIGVLHVKDLLKEARKEGFENVSISEIMKEPIFTPEMTNVKDLLLKMKRTHQQMSIVLDEYGGVVGIATIEDLLEEIVGDIDDEYDESTHLFKRLGNNSYEVEGKLTLNDFNRLFEENLDTEEVDTIAGYLITKIGEIPTTEKKISLELDDGITLISGEVKSSRLNNVIVKLADEKAKQIRPTLIKKI